MSMPENWYWSCEDEECRKKGGCGDSDMPVSGKDIVEGVAQTHANLTGHSCQTWYELWLGWVKPQK